MSPGWSTMASCEDVDSFLARNTSPDHLIRTVDIPLTMKFPAWPKVFLNSLPQNRTYGIVARIAHKLKGLVPVGGNQNWSFLLDESTVETCMAEKTPNTLNGSWVRHEEKEFPKTKKSSMKTCIIFSIISWKIAIIHLWNVPGALHTPKGMRRKFFGLEEVRDHIKECFEIKIGPPTLLGIDGFGLGIGALTGATTGSKTGFWFSTGTTGGWTSSGVSGVMANYCNKALGFHDTYTQVSQFHVSGACFNMVRGAGGDNGVFIFTLDFVGGSSVGLVELIWACIAGMIGYGR
ncbi:hypothetical protein Tco_0037819 [Tanacetum coccineum]